MAPAARPKRIDPDRLPRMRAAAQLLHRPVSASDPAEIARAMAGAQAQDVYAGPLSFRSRSRRLTAADIDRARTEERSLLRTWVMRMTIHLIPTDDADWWLPLFEPEIAGWSKRRLGQLGMPAPTQEKAMRAIARMLERDGPMTRPDVTQRLTELGIELDSMTRGHVAGLAVTSGIACLGPDRGSRACLVRREDWLAKQRPFDHDKALAELARCYMRAFGPATDRDFAYWSGLALGRVRRGLEAISGDLEEARVGDDTLLSLRRHRPRLPREGQVRMLGNFDTYLLGWKDRSFSVPAEHTAAVKEGGGGWIRPVIVRDGLVIGGWRSARKGGSLEISFDIPGRLPAQVRRAIEAEVEDISRFEGVPATLAPGGGG